MHLSPVLRIVDENYNRLAEGMRVMEDIARMILDDARLTSQIKTLRHNLIRSELPFNLLLLEARNSLSDVGASLDVEGEERGKSLILLLVSNSRRTQEALRVLEDLSKLPEVSKHMDSDKFRRARFALYTLEKELVSGLSRQDAVRKISGLYVIIDTQVLGGRSHIDMANQVIQAGVKVIQLRDKAAKKKLLIQTARNLQKLCEQNGVLFIVNDYLDVALASDAGGLHIGQEDLPVDTARRLLPSDKILGVSVATPEEGMEALAAGADYLAVGPIFPTLSKEKAGVVGLERLGQIKSSLPAKIPLVAIGGIDKTSASAVMKAGANCACVISAVLNAEDTALAARELIEAIEVNNEKTD